MLRGAICDSYKKLVVFWDGLIDFARLQRGDIARVKLWDVYGLHDCYQSGGYNALLECQRIMVKHNASIALRLVSFEAMMLDQPRSSCLQGKETK